MTDSGLDERFAEPLAPRLRVLARPGDKLARAGEVTVILSAARVAGQPPAPSWPQALRAVRAWLSPWIALRRWWSAWSKAPPPPQLQAQIDSVAAGCGLHLYVPT